MTKRRTHQPAYIGRARHIWEANNYHIEELLQDALKAGASEITLTLSVPDNAQARKRISVCHTAFLPVSDGFRVVQVDAMDIYAETPRSDVGSGLRVACGEPQEPAA